MLYDKQQNAMTKIREQWIQAAFEGKYDQLFETYTSLTVALAVSVKEHEKKFAKKKHRNANEIKLLDTILIWGQQAADRDFLKALIELSKSRPARPQYIA